MLLTVSVLYPLLLTSTFRTNRADYEFRLLHWFPAGIFVLWILMQFIAPQFRLLYILNLGFYFLWSLPLVALGIAFIIIFVLHVIRRRTIRIAVLGIMLAFFLAGAVSAEGLRWNRRLQAMIFPEDSPIFVVLQDAYLSGKGYLARIASVPAGADASSSSSASSFPVATMMSSSAISSSSVGMLSSSSSFSIASSKASLPPVISSIKPDNLASSGPPEMIALFAVTMGAFYFGLLHRRAEKRV